MSEYDYQFGEFEVITPSKCLLRSANQAASKALYLAFVVGLLFVICSFTRILF